MYCCCMTDAAYTHMPFDWTKPQVQDIPLPKPQPFAAPVFIHDCVTPLAGETLLSLLMKRMQENDQP